jgi:hypothetical protein
MSQITNNDDVIDSRDIIARIDELEDMFQVCQNCGEDLPIGVDHRDSTYPGPNGELIVDCPKCDGIIMSENEREELGHLDAIKDECEDYGDWKYGVTLINDFYFTEYCMELLKGIGDLPQDIPGYIAIDEDQTAENLKVDYATVDFDGVDYFVRNC